MPICRLAGERVLGHLAIARLEDVQGRLHAGKQHDVREGEERQRLGSGHRSEGITQRGTLTEPAPRPKTRRRGMDERLAHGLMERLNADAQRIAGASGCDTRRSRPSAPT